MSHYIVISLVVQEVSAETLVQNAFTYESCNIRYVYIHLIKIRFDQISCCPKLIFGIARLLVPCKTPQNWIYDQFHILTFADFDHLNRSLYDVVNMIMIGLKYHIGRVKNLNSKMLYSTIFSIDLLGT